MLKIYSALRGVKKTHMATSTHVTEPKMTQETTEQLAEKFMQKVVFLTFSTLQLPKRLRFPLKKLLSNFRLCKNISLLMATTLQRFLDQNLAQ